MAIWNYPLVNRHGTAAQWDASNRILRYGEIGLETDTRRYKVGDGVTGWNSLAYSDPAASDLVPAHLSAFNHSLLHAATNDPSTGEKAALAGTSGTPGAANKYVTDGDARNTNARTPTTHGHAPADVTGTAVITTDSRLSDARTPLAHNQDASTINAGTLDGDRLPALSTSKRGGVPATGTPGGLFLKDDGTWAAPAGGGGGLGYAINVQALTSSPADGATVYFGMMPKAPITTANVSKVYIRKAGTIKIAEIYSYSGTAGTAEAWSLYIRKNNTTDILIATVSAATNERVFTNASLNIAMAVGDYFEIKGVQPTWATNPATTIYGGYVYLES